MNKITERPARTKFCKMCPFFDALALVRRCEAKHPPFVDPLVHRKTSLAPCVGTLDDMSTFLIFHVTV